MNKSDTVMSVQRSVFFERPENPYYIVAPFYTRFSAGVKVLHLLCHALNRFGQNAYLIIYPEHYKPLNGIRPDLNTPLLTKSIMKFHYDHGLTPITIYPEVFKGNIFNAPFVVRYFLNYPGLLGGDEESNPNEFSISYSKAIAKRVSNNRQVIFIPVSDPNFFSPLSHPIRSGACFYAGKYREFHGGKLFAITDGLTEITRNKKNSQTLEKIRDLFRSSDLFYCYEDSALAVEAILCECPVVFLPNPYFLEPIAKDELSGYGYAWGVDSDQIKHAKETVSLGRNAYLNLFSKAEMELKLFITETQDAVKKVSYRHMMNQSVFRLSFLEESLWFGRAGMGMLREKGILFTMDRLVRRLVDRVSLGRE